MPRKIKNKKSMHQIIASGSPQEFRLLGIRMSIPFNVTEFSKIDDKLLKFSRYFLGIPIALIPIFMILPWFVGNFSGFPYIKTFYLSHIAFAAQRCDDVSSLSVHYCDSYAMMVIFASLFVPISSLLFLFAYFRLPRSYISSAKFRWSGLRFLILQTISIILMAYVFFIADLEISTKQYNARAQFIVGPMFPIFALFTDILLAFTPILIFVYLRKIANGLFLRSQGVDMPLTKERSADPDNHKHTQFPQLAEKERTTEAQHQGPH